MNFEANMTKVDKTVQAIEYCHMVVEIAYCLKIINVDERVALEDTLIYLEDDVDTFDFSNVPEWMFTNE